MLPDASLGGNPSFFPILPGRENLFSHVKRSQSIDGYVDYRCIYIFNQSDRYSLVDVSIEIIPTTGNILVDVGLINSVELVNSISPVLDAEQTILSSITWYWGDNLAKIDRLGPGDGAPIWLRRIVPAGVPAVVNDGFTLQVKGKNG